MGPAFAYHPLCLSSVPSPPSFHVFCRGFQLLLSESGGKSVHGMRSHGLLVPAGPFLPQSFTPSSPRFCCFVLFCFCLSLLIIIVVVIIIILTLNGHRCQRSQSKVSIPLLHPAVSHWATDVYARVWSGVCLAPRWGAEAEMLKPPRLH